MNGYMSRNNSEMERDDKFRDIIATENKLNDIQDVDVLLESILTETRKIVNADAGSIYVVDGRKLRIKYAQNDTHLKALAPGEKLPYKAFSFEINEHSIAGYVALTKESLNIDDVYKIPSGAPYAFNKDTDRITDYRTRSMFTQPLSMPNGQVLGVLQIINAQNEQGEFVRFDEDAVLYMTHFAANVAHALQNTYLTSNMVRRMLKMSEFRDPKETYPHISRVSEFAVEIYDRYAFKNNIFDNETHQFRDLLKIAAKFHDVGKVGIPDTILKKPGAFTPEERSRMKCHTYIGANLFQPCESKLDVMCSEVALHHHDWWDGSMKGYPGKADLAHYHLGDIPDGCEPMKGTEIPLAARIVAVADVFDALSHKRCYKEAWSMDDAFHEIQKNAGTQFDPEVVAAFMQVKDRICAIMLAYPDDLAA